MDVRVADDHKISSEFIKTGFTLQADEAERISAVHCAKMAGGKVAGSSGPINKSLRAWATAVCAVSAHCQSLHRAVLALRERVQVLHTFLAQVEQGQRGYVVASPVICGGVAAQARSPRTSSSCAVSAASAIACRRWTRRSSQLTSSMLSRPLVCLWVASAVFGQEYNDALAVTYLAVVSKASCAFNFARFCRQGSGELHQVVSDFNVAYNVRSRRRWR